MRSRSSSISLIRVALLGCSLTTFIVPSFAQNATQVFAPTPSQTFAGHTEDSRTNLTNLPTAANSSWTINMFVRPEVALYELTLIGGFGNGRDEAGAQRYLGRTSGGIHFWGGGIDVETDVPFDVGSWQMITATYDGKDVTIYKNGEAIQSAPVTLTDAAPEVRLSPTGTWPLQQQHQFNGRVQGFAIWNGALPPSEIRELMKSMPKV